LISLEKRLNDGYSRSIQRKEQIRLSAQETLQKLGEVVQSHRRLKQESEEHRYIEYLEKKKNYL